MQTTNNYQSSKNHHIQKFKRNINSSLQQSPVIKRKPQSKLSYLKKLFSNKLDNSNSKDGFSNSKEAQFMSTSQKQNNQALNRLIQAHNNRKNNKFIENYQSRYFYGADNTKKVDNIIQRYKESYNVKSSQIKRPLTHQSKKKSQKFQNLYGKNLYRHQSGRKGQSFIKNSKNHTKTLKKQESKYHQGMALNNFQLCKSSQTGNQKVKKDGRIGQSQLEIYQLKRIQKLLRKIKKQISINRSIIVSGFKQLNEIGSNSVERNIYKVPNIVSQQLKKYQINRKHSNSEIYLPKRNASFYRQTKQFKPSVIYNFSQKIR